MRYCLLRLTPDTALNWWGMQDKPGLRLALRAVAAGNVVSLSLDSNLLQLLILPAYTGYGFKLVGRAGFEPATN